MCSATPERCAIRAHTAWIPEGSDGQGEEIFLWISSNELDCIWYTYEESRIDCISAGSSYQDPLKKFPAISQVYRIMNRTSLTRSENVLPMKPWHR